MDNTTSLNILNWNSRSIRNKESEFFNLLDNQNIDIAVVTETWLRPDISIYHHDYTCTRLDRSSSEATRGGGVAIFIRKGIKFTQSGGLNTNVIEALQVTVHTDATPIHLVAAYFPGSSNLSTLNKFKRDLRTITGFSEPCFLLVILMPDTGTGIAKK